MSIRHLGETFDIHGGGQDLIFPHHENEIAQSCSATGKEFARYWVHNGFVTVDQEKMSKSLGNFFTIKEIFEKFPASEKVTAEVVRYFLLSTHYRSPVDFSDKALGQAWAGLDNFYDLFLRLEEKTDSKGLADGDVKELLKKFATVFEQAMDDDFNTPVAIAEFQRLRGELNTGLQAGLSHEAKTEARAIFLRFGQVLGLFQVPAKDWEFCKWIFGTVSEVQSAPTMEGTGIVTAPVTEDEIERRIAERNDARRRKDFARADEIRKALAAQGIILEDRPDGTTRWKR
jgi:cysteinyl-tRNA synthetase